MAFDVKDLIEGTVVKIDNFDDIPSLKLKTFFLLSNEILKDLNMEVLEMKWNDKVFPEIWTFCKFDSTNKPFTKLRRFIVSTYGRVIYVDKRKELKQVLSTMKPSTVSGERYRLVYLPLAQDYRPSRSVHRLVALAFLKKKKGKDVVDHIDENPAHNYVWNLQWTDKSGNSNKHNMYVQRERTGKAVDTTWKYEELVAICKMMAEGHKATYIYNEMLKITNNNPKIQYERIRTLYKHIMKRGDFHDIAVKCGVNFDCNTLKEKGSVARIQEIKNK